MSDTKEGDPSYTAPKQAPGKSPTVTTRQLMGSARELIILHASEQYRLRITSTGKLILTK